MGKVALGVDFSKASGADALVVAVGVCGGKGNYVEAGGTSFLITTLGGKPAEAQAQGDKVVMGGQAFSFDGEKIIFDKIAEPMKLPRQGMW